MFRMSMLAASSVLLLVGSAGAGPRDMPPTRVVNYSDLDISTKAGASTLVARIEGAAKIVCGPEGDRGLRAAAFHEKCMREAIEAAAAQVNAPRVAELMRQRQ